MGLMFLILVDFLAAQEGQKLEYWRAGKMLASYTFIFEKSDQCRWNNEGNPHEVKRPGLKTCRRLSRHWKAIDFSSAQASSFSAHGEFYRLQSNGRTIDLNYASPDDVVLAGPATPMTPPQWFVYEFMQQVGR
jgi:hypothetical protein